MLSKRRLYKSTGFVFPKEDILYLCRLVRTDNFLFNNGVSGAVVVAQLVERSLLIPEVRSLNPVIGKNLLIICLLSTVY